MAVQVMEAGLDCRKCINEEKEERGCEKDSPIPGYWKFDEFETSRCPVKLITKQSIRLLEAFLHFKQGFLPNAGGWMDQPAKLFEAFEIVETELRKIQEKKDKDNAHK
ncbi:MAG: hypothetical protein PHE15_02760 [Dehalococcoidales bacterium]|nr:hypothetical protein [Dehalococcoidales bacterium]